MAFRLGNILDATKASIRQIDMDGLSKADLVARLQSHSIMLNKYADILFSSDLFVPSSEKGSVSIIELSIIDLGFRDGANLVEIQQKANELGLHECPIELGPYFRLQYLDQNEEYENTKNKAPVGSITVMSKILLDDDDFPKGFYLRKIDGKLWLRGYICSMDYHWNQDDRLAFMLE
jgi:hypothetical protein